MENKNHMSRTDMTVQVPVKRKGSDLLVLETFRAYKDDKGTLHIKMDGKFYQLDWLLEICGARCKLNG